MTTTFDFTAFRAQMETIIKERQLAQEQFTTEQFTEALVQAIQCGDFQRMVRVDGASTVIYIPFAESERLRSRIHRLETTLASHNIVDPDKLESEEP